MLIKITVFAAYFLVVLMIGIVARTRWKSTPESYFLADRRLGTLVLLGTMVATNFTAYLLPYLYLVWRERALVFFWPTWLRSPFTFLLGPIFLLSIDVWSWGKTHPLLGGVPAWIWYFVGLSIAQTAVMAVMVHGEKRPDR